MSSPASSTLSPSVIAAIDDLELIARLVVEGLRTGGNRSPFHGYSTEFRQHRPYRQGDDLKHLDWKLFARSDRLYTRQFRETTNLSVMLVLDTSASMNYPAGDLSKFRYATIMAAAIAWLASTQGNAVGLMTSVAGRLQYLPARGGRPHLRSLIALLDRLECGGTWDGPQVISRGAQLLQRRGVVTILSDFYDAEEQTRRALRRVVQYGHDVGMLQLLSSDELELPYDGPVEMQDLETGERRLTDVATVAPQYQRSISEFLERCRREALHAGIDYALIPTHIAPAEALRDVLLRRRRRDAAAPAPALSGGGR